MATCRDCTNHKNCAESNMLMLTLDDICEFVYQDYVEKSCPAFQGKQNGRCDTCKANKVCDHNIYGFENCGSYISTDVAEVKHGQWMPLDPDVDPEGDIWAYCSECEAEISTSWDYDNDNMWTYCPVCGARMDGKEKDNNK